MGRSKDIISEQEFNLQVANKSMALPEDDSPGDSEFDAGEEFDMGVEFTPESAIFDEDDDEVAAFDKQHAQPMKHQRKIEEDIPASARGVSSELPSPWSDSENSSSTN